MTASPAAVVTAAGAERAVTGKAKLMNPNDFLKTLEHDRIVAAVAAAERGTSGQIRVYVSRRTPEDALALARERFAELGLTRTAQRNAVLLFFAPKVRRVAVVGDVGVDARCPGGAAYWQGVIDAMREPLRAGDFTGAIVGAVGTIGALLGEHFPAEPGGEKANELPDDVIED